MRPRALRRLLYVAGLLLAGGAVAIVDLRARSAAAEKTVAVRDLELARLRERYVEVRSRLAVYDAAVDYVELLYPDGTSRMVRRTDVIPVTPSEDVEP